VLLGSLSSSILIFGFQLRLFEAPLSEVSGQDFTSLQNAMWNMCITLTSAGYGDLFPKSYFGRIVGVLIAFWGMLIISFFVVTVTNMLEFTSNEQRSYDLLIRLATKTDMKRQAVAVLQAAYAHRNCKIEHPKDKELQLTFYRGFRAELIKFKGIATIVRSWDNSKKNDSVMGGVLEDIVEIIDQIRENQL
jgi:hypothetical protein